MAHFIEGKRKIVVDIFTNAPVIRRRLVEGGYTFIERDVLSNGFWGTSFIIDRPIGKGADSRIKFLFEEVAR